MLKRVFDYFKRNAVSSVNESEPSAIKDYSIIAESLLAFIETKSDVIVTVTGLSHYFGEKPFEIGKTVYLVKEPGNKYDSNAISVYVNDVGKVGYIANSEYTVKQGTVSADLLRGAFSDTCKAEVLWAEDAFAVCSVSEMKIYDLLYNNAVCFSKDKDYNSALTLFLALEKMGDSIKTLKRISECYLNLNDLKNALCYANKAFELQPEDKGVVLLKKTILERNKKLR